MPNDDVADDRAVEILKRISTLETNRSFFEDKWREIQQLVRPETAEFYREPHSSGPQQTAIIYDATPAWSLDQLASSLNGYLTPPNAPWFYLGIKGVPYNALPRELILWLQTISNTIFAAYSNPLTHQQGALHEMFLDLGSFGTGILFQDWDRERKVLRFKSFPLADVLLAEDSNGTIDTAYRRTMMTGRQIVQMFPDTVPDKIQSHKDVDKRWETWHCVYPRTDRNTKNYSNTNMPFASLYLSVEGKQVLSEGGFRSFPYHTGRWKKLAGEIYGRGPAMTCLPDIKMLNQMMKTVIKSAEKVVDPPLLVPDDGFMLPIKTSPASLNFYTPGSDPMVPLETKGRVDIGMDMVMSRRDQIAKAFYVDWLLQQKNTVEMTATETIDRREEKLNLMAPFLGRITEEALGPMVARTFDILAQANRIPAPQVDLSGLEFELSYTSPAARAQDSIKAVSMQRYTQDIVPYASVDPSILDAVNGDELVSEYARLRNVPMQIMRSPEEVAAIRQQRAQQEAMRQQAEMGQQTSKAIKDVATGQAALAKAQ